MTTRRYQRSSSLWISPAAQDNPTETTSLMRFVERGGASLDKSRVAIPFEDALQMARFGRFNVYLIVICGVIMATSVIETLSISFVLPASECEMHFSSTEKGVLSAVGFAGIITSSYIWGFLSDTKGRRAVIIPSLFLTFLCTLLSSVSPNFWVLITFRYLHGLFISGSSAAVYAYLGEFHTNAERARAIMLSSVVFGIACILMPLVGFLIINGEWELAIPMLGLAYRPWRFFMVAVGLPSLFCALALLALPESPKFELSMGKQSETVAILHWMYRKNGGDAKKLPYIGAICEEAESIDLRERRDALAGSGLSTVVQSMWSQTVPLFRGAYLRSTLISSVMQFGNYVNTNGMYMWFPDTVNRVTEFVRLYPNQTATICEVLAATRLRPVGNGTVVPDAACGTQSLETETFGYTFGLEVLYALGFAFIALIINYFGKCTVLVTLHLVFALSGFTMLFLPMPMESLYLYLVLLLVGLCIPVINAATIDLYPTSMRGMAVCLTVMMGRLGGMIGVNMVALLIENHCELTFGLASGIILVCGFLTFFIPNIMSSSTDESSTAPVYLEEEVEPEPTDKPSGNIPKLAQ